MRKAKSKQPKENNWGKIVHELAQILQDLHFLRVCDNSNNNLIDISGKFDSNYQLTELVLTLFTPEIHKANLISSLLRTVTGYNYQYNTDSGSSVKIETHFSVM